jgi:hypothetical protein
MPFSHTSQPSPQAPRVGHRVQSQVPQGAEVQLLKVVRRGLDADLKLIVVLQAERVVAITPVRGAARRLDVRRTPRLGPDGAQKSSRMKGARAHFHVVGLQNDATLPGPICLQRKNELLKGAGQPRESLGHGMLAKDKAASIATPHSTVLGFTAHSIRSPAGFIWRHAPKNGAYFPGLFHYDA